MSKYHNRKVGGFDSKKEMLRFQELCQMEKEGIISELRRQVVFELIPVQRDENGKVLERKCEYKADFTYYQDGSLVVEDCKGFKTKEYRLKKKMLLYLKGIRIKES